MRWPLAQAAGSDSAAIPIRETFVLIRSYRQACFETREPSRLIALLGCIAEVARFDFELARQRQEIDAATRREADECLQSLHSSLAGISEGRFGSAAELSHVTDSLMVLLLRIQAN